MRCPPLPFVLPFQFQNLPGITASLLVFSGILPRVCFLSVSSCLYFSNWTFIAFSSMSVSFTVLFFSFAYFCSAGSGENEFKACIVTLRSNIDKTFTMCRHLKYHRLLESTGMLGRIVFLERSHSKSFSCN